TRQRAFEVWPFLCSEKNMANGFRRKAPPLPSPLPHFMAEREPETLGFRKVSTEHTQHLTPNIEVRRESSA
ncbi:MAG TPA: hypothetical protein VG347_09720, partial [Verrucomicrobiae bacterium]|nr:hypothetical protein [Verrucomicrobiae bacterium]